MRVNLVPPSDKIGSYQWLSFIKAQTTDNKLLY